ncbi:LecA/PA-IL family lectin [Sinorhizobium numidicum]|uniref:LecA/PA-IL family lectin n=1 Tax=Sinorhizobium numidicum TaxID=680248 RepID=A0ABY8CQ68_9HYPH|nr:LecA/PA-IL family lectin [Sinorhizobium numidicum]WEX74800.1 LecA/PA-IL family lectin [Sinorhizobium numidicum]WEX80793.1 LecA/PA-IL family lectin [Sinorhizobium numidicum]
MAEQEKSVLWTGTLEATAEKGVNTGLTLNTRDPKITITVKGSAKNGPAAPAVGPEGDPNNKDPNALLPGTNIGAVLMRIGGGQAGGGPMSPVGKGLSDWTIRYDGGLTFFYNDVPGEFGNNSGSFDIAVLRQLKWSGTLQATAEKGVQTGVTVNTRTDKISVTVAGSGQWAPQYPATGPDGDTQHKDSRVLLPSANPGAVLIKIGNGPYRVVGTGKSDWPVPEDGEIAFFYNDVAGDFGDNTGSFAITLSVN